MAAVIEVHKRYSLRVSGLLLDNRAANTLTSSSGHAKNMGKKPMVHSPLCRRLRLSRGIIQTWRAI